jgi:type I restriction enzyme S subunit
MSRIKNLPTGWKRKRLEKVAIIQTGIAKNQNSKQEAIELPYLRVANVQDGYLDLSEIKTINIHKDKANRYRLENGDVLLTEGGDFDKLGRGAVWEGQIQNCLHQNHVFAVRPNNHELLPSFLSAQTGSSYGKRYFLSCSKQSTNLASINSSQLKAFPVLLPPLPEQKAIADLLSTWDEAIEKTERLIQAKEKQFKWLLRELISEPRNTQKDAKWKMVKLGDLFGKEIKVEKGKALTKESNLEGEIPVVAGGQTYAYFTNRPTHEIPTVTVSASGAYAGFVWYHDYSIWASDCNVLYATKGVTKFLYFTLKAIQHRVYALQSGGAQPHVYSKDMKNLYILWPSTEEQQQISETLASAQYEIDLLKRLADKYKTQKRGLMQKMLIGDWRVKPEIVNQYMEA